MSIDVIIVFLVLFILWWGLIGAIYYTEWVLPRNKLLTKRQVLWRYSPIVVIAMVYNGEWEKLE